MFDLNQWVYYAAFLVCGAGALILRASNTEYSLIDATKGIKRDKIVWLVVFLMMGYIVFWAAIRNGVADTAEYISSYRFRVKTTIDLKAIFSSDTKAPLFELYQIIMKRLGASWQVYLGSIAIVSGLFVYYGISKYSDDVAFSYYLFITGLFFYWLFNGIRQFFVASVVFVCLRLIVEKKLWKFLFVIMILYFVHKSVIIMIPIYFIVNLKNWSYGIYACVLATVALIFLFPNQFKLLLEDSFTDYSLAENFAYDDGVNILRVLVAMVTPTIAFAYRKNIEKINNQYVNVMINMSLVTAGIYAVGVVTSGIFIGRLPLYTDMFGIILLPFLIKRIISKELRGTIWIACLLLYFLYFHLQIKQGMYYTTNWFDILDLGGARL